jgi:hypothetical protein
MKRIMLVAALALCGALTPAILGQEKQEKPQPKLLEEPLYPLKEGQRWVYKVTDHKAKEGKKNHQVTATVAQQDIHRIKAPDPKAGGAEVQVPYVGFTLRIAGGGKTLDEEVFVKEDGVYRISAAGKQINPPLCILKRPVQKGTSWGVESQSENAVLQGTFKADEEDVQVPAGNYRALVVRSRDFQFGSQKMELDCWYAKGVGMVKQHLRVGNHDVTLELEKIEKAAKPGG